VPKSVTRAGGGAWQSFVARRPGLLTACARGLLRFVMDGLTALGQQWMPQPVDYPCVCQYGYHDHPLAPGLDDLPPPRLDAPPDGHPERLCPHEPMSAAETAIWAGFYTEP
jgi:hypothetical protein